MAPTRSAAQRLIATGAVRWRAPAGWRVPTQGGRRPAERRRRRDHRRRRAALRLARRAEARRRARAPRPRRRRHDLPRPRPEHRRLHRRAAARGAKHVVGVDVGHGQLHPRLAADARVTRARRRQRAPSARRAQLPFADASTSSSATCRSSRSRWSCRRSCRCLGGPLLLLVKPQFELQPVDIGAGGKVKDASAYGHVEKKLRKACAANGLDGARLVRQRHRRQRRRARILPPRDAGPRRRHRRHDHCACPFRSASSSFRPTRRSAARS